jgi:Flp pilus assembly protein TadG
MKHKNQIEGHQRNHSSEERREVRWKKRGEEGFSLLMIAVSAVVMVGMLGLAFDLGRLFIVRNELQTFVDAAAVAACRQMAGSQASIRAAHGTASAGPLANSTPNGWNFDTSTISNVTDTYATTFNGTYDSYATASGGTINAYRFVNVTANATTPLYFLAVIPGVPRAQLLQATATAGQQAQSSIGNGGLEPFMPDAHNPAGTANFGFTPGTEYTLKWGSGGGGGNGNGGGGNATTTCGGDLGFTDPNPSSQHGFVDLGQGNGNSSLRGLIVYGGYPNANSTPSSVSVGTTLGGDPGNRGTSVFSALAERSNQDPDQTSTTYDQYVAAGIGNGRRIVTVPIGDPSTWSGNGNGTEQVIGFANFLLDSASTISGSSGPICATYIGLGTLNGASSGGTEQVIGFANFLLDSASTISGSSGAICATYIGPGSLNGASSGGTDGSKVYSVMLYR